MHSNQFPGLQQHSVGPIYPWTILVKGCKIHALHTGTDKLLQGFEYNPNVPGSFQEAHDKAEQSIKLHEGEMLPQSEYDYSYDQGYWRRHKKTGEVQRWNQKSDGTGFRPVEQGSWIPQEFKKTEAA